MEERIKTLCGLYLGWNGTEHRIVVERLGKETCLCFRFVLQKSFDGILRLDGILSLSYDFRAKDELILLFPCGHVYHHAFHTYLLPSHRMLNKI